ncbi:glycosyltransferase [Cellulomonas fimi]|uniref:Glycosyl transferase group 1 n=1 Tax=Cellulomonas fimi (strain ATCC 484 / DSM 20113 / JCM 1341 / CCUG 24087 / LMG 16345 / NBRC 15513 / NCIMB 8980 / NCTC 7547 / NRS-133) TaxID=590998 RepID=F4H5Z0_CELFA|nr:glycosyltransferase [Cellulomonas fimi]AEE46720.1 glycosyl transferase group 1 [Cellulomonas fimi ATCC 484]NNH07635.1 glycosyltransferase [Cellulomonas fimi]VEH33982.1 D-inositol-3-phosphate glycosyltransferase [Cellulomonas fimi]
MRIAMVSEHASPLAVLGGVDAGGQNVHVAALAAALAGLGHTVDVYTRRDDPGLPPEVDLCPGVRVRHVDAGPPEAVPKDDLLPWMPQFARVLVDAWAHERPDVVHAHFWMSGLAAVQAGEATGVPVVQTFHALGSVKRRHQGAKDTSPPGRVVTETTVGRRVAAVVATCTDEVTELSRMGVPVGHVRVVPCGVDVAHFSPAAAPAGPPRREPVRLLVVGRLVERKGVDTVIDALADLPDAELCVAGGPGADDLDGDPEVVRLRARATARGVADRVHLLGRVAHDAMPGLLRSADVVVATPWYEPFGIVPLEAAACGVPVVGSAVGGLLDSVVDGRTGVLVPPRDPQAVARAVRSLVDAPVWAAATGRAARERAVRLYAWERVAAATAEVYATVTTGVGTRDGVGTREVRAV